MIVDTRSGDFTKTPSATTAAQAGDACRGAARLRDTLSDDVLRKAMRRHVERCSACREQMLIEEPTTLFRRLPKVELSSQEVAEMRQRVKGVRRGRRVGDVEGVRGSRRSAWAAAAATVCILGGLGAFQLGLQGGAPGSSPVRSADPSIDMTALSAEDEARLDRALASRALIDGGDVLSEQVVLMQVAGRASDLAWVANDRLDL